MLSGAWISCGVAPFFIYISMVEKLAPPTDRQHTEVIVYSHRFKQLESRPGTGHSRPNK